MNHKQLQRIEREFWGSLAMSLGPEFWLSATFLRPYTDEESIAAFKFAMRSIQKRIHTKRTIRGMASIERTWKNARFEGCLHLHALLWGVDGNAKDPDAFISELVSKSFGRLRDGNGLAMTSPETIDVRRVHEPDGVTKYMTKDAVKPSHTRSRIWLIRSYGFDTTTDYYE